MIKNHSFPVLPFRSHAALFLMVALLVSLISGQQALANPAVVFDVNTGKVLYAEAPHRRWYPASTTKLMTAYLVFEALRDGRVTMQDDIVSTKTALKEPPSKLGLPVGTVISLDVALDALIIKSANDVAVMLAEKLAGDVPGFAKMMNAKARQLGMTRTHFANPNGLHNPQHYTTAHDMALLAAAVVKDFPEHAARFTKARMKIGKRVLSSYNSLIKRHFPGAIGMKTGFVCASGYNIVGAAKRHGVHLISVVFGARSGNDRHNRTTALLEYGFAMHDWKSALFNDTLANIPVEDERSVDQAGNMRPVVCAPRVAKKRKRRIRRRKINRRKKTKILKKARLQ